MKNRINWGNVFWGVLIALNVATFVSLVIEGHWLCATGWLLAALYGLLYRVESSISETYRRSAKRWMDEYESIVFKEIVEGYE